MASKSNKNLKLFFKKISANENQILDLYNLLKERKFNISHSSMPSFKEHSQFVTKHPYREWFILYDANVPVGNFYIKNDNSIGMNMLEQNSIYINATMEFIKQNFTPNRAVASQVPPYFYLNVAFKNDGLRRILEDSNLKPMQISYRI